MGLRPDDFTLSSLVKASNCLEENEIAHGVCMRLGFGSSAYLVSGLIENYARNGDVGSAEKCFGDCLAVDNVVLTAMICGYVWNGEFEKGKEVFSGMCGLGLELNEFSLTGVLGALHVVREGEQIHGIGFKMGLLFSSSVHLSNAIMNMYSRCGSKQAALKMFDEIIEPDVVSWTERIGAANDDAEALKLFKILHSEDLEINEYTIINVVSAIAGLWMLRPGEQIQALSLKAGYFHAASVSNVFVLMYGKCGQMDNARCIFDNMLCRDTVSWNSLIAGYSENRLDAQAFEMFCQMVNFFPPDRYTLASILEIVSNFNSATLATQIHCHVIKLGFMMDDHVISCLVTSYGKCNLISESKGVFAEVYKPNIELLNAMTTTFVRASCHADALTLFRTSRCLCLEVDSTTFCTILKACGATSDLEQGRVIHCLAHKSGYDQDSFVETSIIDIYCKCGNIGDAEKAFRHTSKDNLASWNAMMMGYAQHGFHYQLSRLFNKMSEVGLKPDEITYLGVLTSCCHTGLVEEACFHLNSMFEFHGILPHVEHYACVVDLLGRLGLLIDAKRTIDQMPVDPDAHIWQILLSACSIHRNVDLGKLAAKNLLELQPGNESAYILLANIYASAGMWSSIAELRKKMKEKILCKEPASSWVQIGGSIHSFFADDISHPDSKEVHMELMRLSGHMLMMQKWEKDGFSLTHYGL